MYAQPLLFNGTLLVVTMANMIYGLNATSGARLWGRQLTYPDGATAMPPFNVALDFPWCTDARVRRRIRPAMPD